MAANTVNSCEGAMQMLSAARGTEEFHAIGCSIFRELANLPPATSVTVEQAPGVERMMSCFLDQWDLLEESCNQLTAEQKALVKSGVEQRQRTAQALLVAPPPTGRSGDNSSTDKGGGSGRWTGASVFALTIVVGATIALISGGIGLGVSKKSN